MWIEMHSLSADEEGNLYGTDNQAGRPQKWSNEETLIPIISCLDLGSKTRVLILAIAIDLA